MATNKEEANMHSGNIYGVIIQNPRNPGAAIKHKGYCMKNFHEHNYYEIINIDTPDDEYIYICAEKYRLSHNRIFIIPPHTPHTIIRTTHRRKLLLNFSVEYIREIFNFLHIDKNDFNSANALEFSNEQIDSVLSISYELMNIIAEHGSCISNGKANLLIANIFDILTNPMLKLLPDISNAYIHSSQLIEYLKNNYSENINLDFLAKQFLTSKFSLCKQFKKETGESIINFLGRIRLNHSRDLLENSSITISDIAYKVGYDSPAYFSRAFKKSLGISPLEYRNKFRKK